MYKIADRQPKHLLHNVSETEVSNGVDHMIYPIHGKEKHGMNILWNDFASSRLNLFNFLHRKKDNFLNYVE